MRRVTRAPLTPSDQRKLDRKQAIADHQIQEGTFMPEAEWKRARKTKLLRAILAVLKSMMGDRERCMYCLDSHGTDIEHFWPKTPYPEKMFKWPNLLLCCTECGRLKGDRFPLSDDLPLLIDPTSEDPWSHLDFDPDTGNVVARFDIEQNDWSPKGLKTVEILQLDRREALAAGYKRTFNRISSLIARELGGGLPPGKDLSASFQDADDHGLLGWCLLGAGQSMPPFEELRQRYPGTWAACVAAVQNL
jgi:uncharacterized protein (TIGR02646 family)